MESTERVPGPHDIGRPSNEPSAWRLHIGGLVANELDLTVNELDELAREAVSGPPPCPDIVEYTGYSFAGPSLQAVLQRAGVSPDARYVSVQSGPYIVVFSLETVADQVIILATRRDGAPVPFDGGGPIRLVPGSGSCMESVKWVQGLWLDPDAARATAPDLVSERRAANRGA